MRTLARVSLLALVPALVLGALSPVVPAKVIWTKDVLDTRVGFAWGPADVPVVVPLLGYRITPDEEVACLGSVVLKFTTGAASTVPSLAHGDAACADRPALCEPFASLPRDLVASCEPSTFLCCQPVVIRRAETLYGADLADFGCLQGLYITREGVAQDEAPERFGPFYGALSECDA